MVRSGQHSLRIIDASSGDALREFQHLGNTWVAGRPGQQFYIEITSHELNTRTIATVQVDGVDIGYIWQHGPDINMQARLGPSAAGMFKQDRTNFTKEVTAFRFATMQQSSGSQQGSAGSVSVVWNLGQDTEIPTHGDQTNEWNEPNSSLAPDSKKEGVGALRSTVGDSPRTVALAKTSWIKLKEVSRLNINYCEEAGVIARNIASHEDLQEPTKRNSSSGPELLDLTGGTGTKKAKTKKTTAVPDLVDLTKADASNRDMVKKESGLADVIDLTSIENCKQKSAETKSETIDLT